MPESFFIVCALLTATAVGGLAWVLLSLAAAPRVPDPALGYFEIERREKVRAASSTYRWFEPWIDEIAAYHAHAGIKSLARLRQDLVGSGDPVPWTAEEFLAVRRIEAILAGLAGAAFGWFMFGAAGAAGLFAIGYIFYVALMTRQVRVKSRRRMTAIKRRFASAIDLMALMMEVGASFQQSLSAVAKELRGHPLGDEFDRVLSDIELGRPRREALQSFSDRVPDDDINELVHAVVEGESLGTPVADMMRTQAEQIRQKRSQWAEKAAEESQVALVFPAMVIMVACLIIVVAPFILSALYYSG
jgi:tight adherence protein C